MDPAPATSGPTKTCRLCVRPLPLSCFRLGTLRRDGKYAYRGECKACHNDQRKLLRRKQREGKVQIGATERLSSYRQQAWDAQHSREDSLRARLNAIQKDVTEVALLRRENLELQRYNAFLADQLVAARQELNRRDMLLLIPEPEPEFEPELTPL